MLMNHLNCYDSHTQEAVTFVRDIDILRCDPCGARITSDGTSKHCKECDRYFCKTCKYDELVKQLDDLLEQVGVKKSQDEKDELPTSYAKSEKLDKIDPFADFDKFRQELVNMLIPDYQEKYGNSTKETSNPSFQENL